MLILRIITQNDDKNCKHCTNYFYINSTYGINLNRFAIRVYTLYTYMNMTTQSNTRNKSNLHDFEFYIRKTQAHTHSHTHREKIKTQQYSEFIKLFDCSAVKLVNGISQNQNKIKTNLLINIF